MLETYNAVLSKLKQAGIENPENFVFVEPDYSRQLLIKLENEHKLNTCEVLSRLTTIDVDLFEKWSELYDDFIMFGGTDQSINTLTHNLSQSFRYSITYDSDSGLSKTLLDKYIARSTMIDWIDMFETRSSYILIEIHKDCSDIKTSTKQKKSDLSHSFSC